MGNRMARKPNGQKGFLARLLRNQSGNVLAMTAAFLIPLLGLVGGGVDMSRIYLAKTRLQQACDAGALAGRKAMADGSWTPGTATSTTEGRALNMFSANFKDGSFGSGTVTKNFSESGGVVSGTASVTMPMMVIKVLGITSKSISVSCTAKMEIPNTDVMFVIDNTGSMNCQVAHSGYSCPGGDNYGVEDSVAKMKGLRSAIKCFYEALAKIDTTENCGSTPSGTVTAQIRFGFMPYSVNVNVGKLLPNSFLADSWTYQSREPIYTTVYAWTAGAESAISWGSWPSNPSSLTNASTYSGWGDISTSGSTTVTVNGVTYTKRPTGYNSTTCLQLNTMTPDTLLTYSYTTNLQTAGATGSSTPTYPADTVQTLNYSQDDDRQAIGYRYRWSTSGSGSCRLQSSNNYPYTITRTGSSTKPLTWTSYNNLSGWTYKEMSHNISGLKAGGSSWNASVALPLTSANGASVTLSGSTTPTYLQVVANTNVAWTGCIEERQTFQNTNSSTITTTDWNPIPATAYDTDFVTVPTSSNSATLWGPILRTATWLRYDNSGNKTLAQTTNASQTSQLSSVDCPTEAKKLQVWSTASSLETYLASLVADGSTYHDIGMVWGARFISPSGIFASENAATPSGQPIQRHIVFMTDGDTNTSTTNHSAYGVTWWNRRQTSYAPSSSNTNSIVDTRLSALCSAIKNQNITLWVVSYGGSVNATTETRLQNCASTPNAPSAANTHFFSATDTATLIAKFKQIASEIADLRLIS
ncbi:Tad domain-containing protein [Sphingobium sp. DEHP117]|uniref:TadE/TadG family type IV pilus assembly protein n=1 Tax=Sphingobium sp. DEHP117 TaxID=2993436 RepID=UPI0027D59A07|nr:pilus assembly protein TadG-related protein [Sphingobium sp. DEHP117]MDQ4419854.1 Tad domain-containing protein [Sphingobium sp. DEHP117]